MKAQESPRKAVRGSVRTTDIGIDRSAVVSNAAREALDAIVEAFDIPRLWSGLDAAEDAVRRAALALFARLGRGPTESEIAAETNIAESDVAGLIAALEKRDIVVHDPAGGALASAYPFCDRATAHRVSLGERRLNAMCAIDALGIGAMLGRETTVETSCSGCNAGIGIAIGDAGTVIDRVDPFGAIVWSSLEYEGACAATSMCPGTVFFCSEEHLWSWREKSAGTEGCRLSIAEGLEVARALFGKRLAAAG